MFDFFRRFGRTLPGSLLRVNLHTAVRKLLNPYGARVALRRVVTSAESVLFKPGAQRIKPDDDSACGRRAAPR
jgi:hypothetical protein